MSRRDAPPLLRQRIVNDRLRRATVLAHTGPRPHFSSIATRSEQRMVGNGCSLDAHGGIDIPTNLTGTCTPIKASARYVQTCTSSLSNVFEDSLQGGRDDTDGAIDPKCTTYGHLFDTPFAKDDGAACVDQSPGDEEQTIRLELGVELSTDTGEVGDPKRIYYVPRSVTKLVSQIFSLLGSLFVVQRYAKHLLQTAKNLPLRIHVAMYALDLAFSSYVSIAFLHLVAITDTDDQGQPINYFDLVCESQTGSTECGSVVAYSMIRIAGWCMLISFVSRACFQLSLLYTYLCAALPSVPPSPATPLFPPRGRVSAPTRPYAALLLPAPQVL